MNPKICFLTFCLVGLFLNRPAFGKDFLQELGLSAEHTIDLLNVCFNEKLACKVFTRTKGELTELITIIGENHKQDESTFLVGAKLLEHYPVIGLEGATLLRTGTELLKWDTSKSWIPDFWVPTLYQKDFRPKGPVEGYSFLKKYQQTRSVSCSKAFVNLEPNREATPAQLAAANRNFQRLSKVIGSCGIGTAGIALVAAYLDLAGYSTSVNALCSGAAGVCALSAGIFFRGYQIGKDAHVLEEVKDSENAVKRDIAMAQMLSMLSEDTLKGVSRASRKTSFVASAVGMSHLYGLRKNLMTKEFVDRTTDVMGLFAPNKSQLKNVLLNPIDDPIYPAWEPRSHIAHLLGLTLAYPEIGEGYLTPLMLATYRGYKDRLESLLKNKQGIDINAQLGKPFEGCSALFLAALQGRLDLVQTLVKHGADPSIPAASAGWDPLLLAVNRRDAQIVAFLLKHGANPNVISNGSSPLSVAAVFGDLEIAHLLLENGADVNLPGAYPAVLVAAENGHLEMVRFLLKNKAKVDYFWISIDKRDVVRVKKTALMQASQNGHKEVVKLLLDNGANLNLTDQDEMTALGIATSFNETEVVEILKAAKAKLR